LQSHRGRTAILARVGKIDQGVGGCGWITTHLESPGSRRSCVNLLWHGPKRARRESWPSRGPSAAGRRFAAATPARIAQPTISDASGALCGSQAPGQTPLSRRRHSAEERILSAGAAARTASISPNWVFGSPNRAKTPRSGWPRRPRSKRSARRPGRSRRPAPLLTAADWPTQLVRICRQRLRRPRSLAPAAR
jgi:hypothetical protein